MARGLRYSADRPVLRSTSWISAHFSSSQVQKSRLQSKQFGPRLRIGRACAPTSIVSHCRSRTAMESALAWPTDRRVYIFSPPTIHRSRRNPKVPGFHGAEVRVSVLIKPILASSLWKCGQGKDLAGWKEGQHEWQCSVRRIYGNASSMSRKSCQTFSVPPCSNSLILSCTLNVQMVLCDRDARGRWRCGRIAPKSPAIQIGGGAA